MFANQQVLSLFPTLIAAQEVTGDRKAELNRALAGAVLGLAGSATGPWQSDGELFLRPAFAELTDCIVESGLQVLAALQAEHAGLDPVALTAQLDPPGSMRPPTQHPNAYLAGVYLAEGSGQDQLRLWDPRPQAGQIAPAVLERNPLNAAEATIPVPAGRLLLFPAWLLHALLPAPGRRIAFSFALVFRDFAETIAPPRWTGLTAGRGA